MGQSIQTGLTQSEVVSSTSGVALTPLCFSTTSSGITTTMGTVPVGKKWRVHAIDQNASSDGRMTNYVTVGGVVANRLMTILTGNSVSVNLGENYIEAAAGTTITHVVARSGGTVSSSSANVYYEELDA